MTLEFAESYDYPTSFSVRRGEGRDADGAIFLASNSRVGYSISDFAIDP